MKFTEDEFELWDDDYQLAIKILLDSKKFLESKSKIHYKYEIEKITDLVEQLFQITYDLRKENVEWNE